MCDEKSCRRLVEGRAVIRDRARPCCRTTMEGVNLRARNEQTNTLSIEHYEAEMLARCLQGQLLLIAL